MSGAIQGNKASFEKTAREEVDGITRMETLRRGRGRCGKMKSMNERGLRGM